LNLCACIEFFVILQRINYCKKDSDAIAKMKGTFVERPKKKKREDEEDAPAKKKKSKAQRCLL
jgi:hypothetical protein